MLLVGVRGLRRARRRLARAARGVARLRGVPRRLAVVAEGGAAAGRQARQLRAGCATSRYYRETGQQCCFILILPKII